MSWPIPNSSLIRERPSWLSEEIFCRPSRPLSTSSCLLVISRSISAGAAPGQLVCRLITGLRTSGVSWIGIFASATTPNKTTINTAAITATGSIAMRIRYIAA